MGMIPSDQRRAKIKELATTIGTLSGKNPARDTTAWDKHSQVNPFAQKDKSEEIAHERHTDRGSRKPQKNDGGNL